MRSRLGRGRSRGLLSLVVLGFVWGGVVACEGAPFGAADDAGGSDAAGTTGGADARTGAADAVSQDGDADERLVSEPGQVTFAAVALGESGAETVALRNAGTATLRVERVVLDGDEAFSVVVSGETLTAGPAPGADLRLVPPIELAAGETLPLPVAFTRWTPAAAAATLRVEAQGAQAHTATVALNAPAVGAALSPTPEALDFGTISVGTTQALEVTVTAPATQAVVLSALSIESTSPEGAFLLDAGTPATPITLDPGATLTLVVRYTPAACPAGPTPPGPDTAVLRLATDDGAAPTEIPLTGRCAAGDDPLTPAIRVEEGSQVIPQTELHLSLVGSETASRYVWRVDQPVGSRSVFVPAADFPMPTFEANVAGTYRFTLDAWDENDAPLAPTAYEVQVVPGAALHVELLWSTPGDPDETDGGPSAGADLDLHFVHPDAPSDATTPDRDGDGSPDPWFDAPLDCYWYNATPDWGVFGDPLDDPHLDLDDTDGAGPENVNLDAPEDGARYRLAVHAWDDHGFGESFATVRVYFDGALAWEASDVRLVSGDLWCAAFVDAAAREVVPCEAQGDALRITSDYQPPAFQP